MKTKIVETAVDSNFLRECGYNTMYKVYKYQGTRRKYWLWGPEIEVWSYVDYHLSITLAQKIAERISGGPVKDKVVWESDK